MSGLRRCGRAGTGLWKVRVTPRPRQGPGWRVVALGRRECGLPRERLGTVGLERGSRVAREVLRRSRLAGLAAHPFGARAELGARPRACVSTAESERAFRSPAPARQPGRSALSAAGGPRGDARAAACSPPCPSETLRPSGAPLESWTSFWVMLFWIGLCTSGSVVLWVSAHT